MTPELRLEVLKLAHSAKKTVPPVGGHAMQTGGYTHGYDVYETPDEVVRRAAVYVAFVDEGATKPVSGRDIGSIMAIIDNAAFEGCSTQQCAKRIAELYARNFEYIEPLMAPMHYEV